MHPTDRNTPPPQPEPQHDGGATLVLDSEKKEEVVETYSEHNNDPPEFDYLSGSKLFCVLSGLTLAGFLMLIDSSIVATAVPTITSEFNSLDDIGWYGTAYLMTIGACQPLSGKIYSYFNIKWSFLCCFLIFEVGSALCGGAQSSAMLIIGRAIAGVGASGLLNGAYTILALTVAPEKQASIRGILTGLCFLGLLAGPLIGGVLTSHASWRWCFYINLPCGVVIAGLLIMIPVPRYRVAGNSSQTIMDRVRRLDIVGFFLFAPIVIMFNLALNWGGTRYEWSSATILGLFCGSFGNLLAFLAWEQKVGSDALVPLALLRRRVIWTSCLFMAFLIGGTMTTSYYFPVWFQAVHGESPAQSGVDLLPIIGTNTVVSMVTGGMISRLGYYTPFAMASGLLHATGSGLVTTLTPTSSRSRRIGFQILQGMQGLGSQVPVLAAQNGVRREEVAVASALVVLAQNLSASVFLSLGEAIFSTELRKLLTQYTPTANIDEILAAGAAAADIKAIVPADLLPQVQRAYSDTFNRVMYLATGSSSAAFIVAMCMGWKKVKGSKKRVKGVK